MADNGLNKLTIRDIGPDDSNILIVGIIIRKQEPRIVVTKKDNTERCVWCFTIRDRPPDMINVTAWGLSEVAELSRHFQVGDVVELSNVRAVFRRIGENDEIYQPSVTSSFVLMYNENKSTMRLYEEDVDTYSRLLHIPTKPPGHFFTISDVQGNSEKLRDHFINLLAGISKIGDIKQLTTKEGRNLECREVMLIDQTQSTLSLNIWDSDLLFASNSWKPRITVLFLADVRVRWNSYRKMINVTASSRTIITENPQIKEAENLKIFLKSLPELPNNAMDQMINKYSDPSKINTVMSCDNILDTVLKNTSQQFTALVYAMITQYNIDGEIPIAIKKCKSCGARLNPNITVCQNDKCLTEVNGRQTAEVYDVRMSLSDHTHTLYNCRVSNAVVQKMIGCAASDFKALSREERTGLKWRYLMKYCAARLVILPSHGKLDSLYTVLSLDPITLTEYSNLIPMQ